jgi:hypothetical protein
MMDEEKTRKALDNLVRDIAVSTKRSKTLSQLTNKELAEKLISDVWGLMKLFGEKSDLLTEAIERLFVLDTPERVYCTADGEFPEDGEVVYYEIYDVHYFGKFLEKEATISRWKDFSDEQPYDWYKLDVPIYWKPLTSFKDEYERQKGQL